LAISLSRVEAVAWGVQQVDIPDFDLRTEAGDIGGSLGLIWHYSIFSGKD